MKSGQPYVVGAPGAGIELGLRIWFYLLDYCCTTSTLARPVFHCWALPCIDWIPRVFFVYMLSVFLVNSNSQWVRWGNGCDRWLDGHLQHDRNTKQNNRGFIHFPLVFSSTKQLFKTFQGAQNQTTLTNQVGILTGAKLQGSVCALLVKSKVHRSVHNLIRFFLLRIQWMMENKCSGCSDFVLHSRKQLKWFTEQIHMLTHTHTKKVIKSQLKSYHTAWSSLLFATVIIFTLPL